MTRRRIGFLGFDGVQALDLVGPADAFSSDAFGGSAEPNGAMAESPYEIVVVGLQGKRFTSSAGITMHADAVVPTTVRLDTLIIPGGAGLRRPGVAELAAKWIGSRAPHIRRVASVCTGIYGLAPTGLLDGRRVTTHWNAVRDIKRRFPKLRVDPDALFLKDGRFYTSAGITAGIDLSLALIEEDFGPSVALSVARELVVYLKRPGGQAQYSEPLQFQTQSADRMADIASWIVANLHKDLGVEVLATRARLCPRQFTRRFKRAFGTTPAAFIESARIDEARRRLAGYHGTLDRVASSVGFRSDDVFRRTFERRLGITPSAYRTRFGAQASLLDASAQAPS